MIFCAQNKQKTKKEGLNILRKVYLANILSTFSKEKTVHSQYFQNIPILVDTLQNKKFLCKKSNQGPTVKVDSSVAESKRQ